MSVLSGMTGIRARKPDPPKDLEGKVFIVTGGHAGIGLVTTEILVRAGARVIIASRTESKVEEAKKTLQEKLPDNKDMQLGFLKLNLSSLKEVKKSAEECLAKETRLDGIVCNAGIMDVPYELTEDGIEQQFQVNHLSHFLFVTKLEPLLAKTGKETGHPSRIVFLSSWAHHFIGYCPTGSVSFKSLEEVNRTLGPGGAFRYGQSKLANILCAKEFNKRMGPHARALAVHPGFVKTPLYNGSILGLAKPILIPVEDGALTSIYALTSPQVEEKQLWGQYFVPHGRVRGGSKQANDEVLAKDLWDLSETLVNEKTGATL